MVEPLPPDPPKRSAVLFVRLTPEDKVAVEQVAVEHGLSLSAAVVMMIRRHVKDRAPTPAPAMEPQP